MIASLMMASLGDIAAIEVIAHRGNSSENPENTMVGFNSAIEMHADYIELDVHLNKEGIPIVIHDITTQRTTNSSSNTPISKLSMNKLKALDAGVWFDAQFAGEQIPTLEEVLTMPLHGTGVMIEVKRGSAPKENLAAAVAQAINNTYSSHLGHKIYIGSMSKEILHEIRKLLPNQPIIAIIESASDYRNHMLNSPDITAFSKAILTKEMIDEVHSFNKKVWVWTVDSPDTMRQLIEHGVDGIITNRPKILQSILREYQITHHQ